MAIPQKINHRITTQSSKAVSGYIPKNKQTKKKAGASTDFCTPMSTALFTLAKTWKEPKCPSTDEWIKKM